MPKDLVTRGEDGLLPAQREYLQKYGELGSESAARKELQFSNARVTRWHREEEDFRKAFNTVVDGIHEGTAQRLKSLEEELPESIRRLMKAQKPMKITCPFNKDHKFSITVDHPVVQARMVEMLMKSQGHLIDRKRIESEIIHSEGLSISQKIALSLHHRGKEISEQSKRELLALGLIEEVPELGVTVEGEAREVEEE
jgi:hypothetical protein